MKKNNDRDCCVPLFRKTMRVMKITTLFSLATACCISASIYAQNYKVSVNKQNSSIIEVLKEIEQNSEFTFFFNDNRVNVNKKVSVNAKNVTLEEILDQLFANTGYKYQIIDRQVLIKASEEARMNSNVSQQNKKTITGVIKDESGLPVIGANVVEKGTTNGTITDAEGKFTLAVEPNAMLAVTYIGYVTNEISVSGKNSVSITLKEDSELLDEVVVVGYGTMKKKDLTGAVGAIKGEDLAARKTTQLSTALQGAVAGVTVTRSSGAPDAVGTIRVRGITTIGDNNPLVIIDGVPGSMNDVNANDVESMTVLKDAASSSIYGSRAAAGVVLITTKRAKENDLSLNYSFEYGMEILAKYPKNVGAQRYMEVANELKYNDNPSGGMYQTYPQDWVENWDKLNKENPDKYPITDWNEIMFDKTAPRQSHVLTLAGGSKAVKTNASFSYDKTDGLYYNRYYERFMLRVNNDFKFNKYIGAKLDFNFKRAKNHKPAYEEKMMMEHTRVMPAIWSAMWSDGRYGYGRDNGNPLALLHEGGEINEWYNQVGGRATLELTPVDGLVISGVVAPTYSFNKIKNFKKAVSYTLLDDPNTVVGNRNDAMTTKLTEKRNDNYNVTYQFLANYTKSFGKHDLNLMAGYENYYAFYEDLMASRDQYELTNYPYLDIGPLAFRDNSGSAQEVAYRSWFGRAVYNYDNRYLLQANIRYDGSSRFHKDYRWGAFPSFSAGWVVSEESFIKNTNINWLSFLKLRGSWGTLGNERILDSNGNQNYYPYQAAMGFGNMLFFQNGKPISQLTAAQQYYAIQNISWEKTESFDIGVDANFFNNRLHFAFDYYKKTTEDMLLALEIPDYVGFDNPQKNTGDMHTNGYDIELGWNDQIGDLSYSVSVNFSDYISKMGNLGGTEFLGDKVKFEDSQFDEWYGYINEGLFLTEEDLANSPKLNNNIKVGDAKYKDISGPEGTPDGKISPEYDRVLLGGSLPRYLYGGNIRLGYKGFDLSMAFQGVGSQKVKYPQILIQPIFSEWGSVPEVVDGDFWSSKNTDEQNGAVKFPRASTVNAPSNFAMSDLWLFNGRYFRMKNITLGYTLPSSITNKVLMKHARVYVSANDIFTISQYPKGWDPEMPSHAYPITASVLFGLSVNF